jgi:hypothetical protein
VNPLLKLAVFALFVVSVFFVALAVGSAVGPVDTSSPPAHADHSR